jgi:hypothetical protein
LNPASADFSPQQQGPGGAVSVFAADLDGDGDPDGLLASQFFSDDKIACKVQ